MNTALFYFFFSSIGHFFISHLMDSWYAVFLGVSIVDSLAGLMANTALISMLYLIKCIAAGFSPVLFLTRLPGLCGAFYWKIDHALFRCGIPLLCMMLFLMHETGYQAWGYSLFWLIPITVYVSKSQYFVWHAFASTFTTHAVGSVIWIYTKPTTVAYWWGLIPVVIVERSLIVVAICLLYRLFLLIMAHDKRRTVRGHYDQTFSDSDGWQSSMGKTARATSILWPWTRLKNSSKSY